MHRRTPLSQRFWSHVARGAERECWLWTAKTCGSGYGQIRSEVGRKTLSAQRVSYELNIGPIPDGMSVCHHCDNRPCAENMADMAAKGRARATPRFGEQSSTAKLTAADIAIIREPSARPTELAARFGVSKSQIFLIRSGKAWRHIPLAASRNLQFATAASGLQPCPGHGANDAGIIPRAGDMSPRISWASAQELIGAQ